MGVLCLLRKLKNSIIRLLEDLELLMLGALLLLLLSRR